MIDIKQPIVTVICLCYNHEKFVIEALKSVLGQPHPNIQLIVVDDFSQDNSVSVIKDFLSNKPSISFIENKENIGNCKAFNNALKQVKGKYVIDLAADDLLETNQLAEQVTCFEEQMPNVGVIFSNAQYIDEGGNFIKNHYPINEFGFAVQAPPQGSIYVNLIKRYFICPPTLMVKTQVLKELDGYDENLAYEDFDFWIRSSRKYNYAYLDKVLIKKRVVKGSLSTQYRKKRMLDSTFQVCKKIYNLNENPKEYKALLERLIYEAKPAFQEFRITLIAKYLILFLKTFRKSFFRI